MNKFLCGETKKRNKFKRTMCGFCTYSSRCVDYQEHLHGHNDEHRDAMHASNDVANDHIGKI